MSSHETYSGALSSVGFNIQVCYYFENKYQVPIGISEIDHCGGYGVYDVRDIGLVHRAARLSRRHLDCSDVLGGNLKTLGQDFSEGLLAHNNVLHTTAPEYKTHNHFVAFNNHAVFLGPLRTATAGSDVVQSGRPIFDDFFQHLWPYIGNNTANVVFQMVKRLWLIRIDQ
ncbi:hypothetical protein TNCV_1900071 [Trichonephila clavipes]|nr:hypothetical protein TNCV_1900071 [Trichonephila clavipes]